MSAELFSLEGKIALVTGASGGLGAHFAVVLARAGARIAVAARRIDMLEPLVARIQASGGRRVRSYWTSRAQRAYRVASMNLPRGARRTCS